MERKLLLGTDLILFITVTLAWDCSDREERAKHAWCDHGCCFEKDPVRCCTWAESMGSVFWTLMGLGAGMFLLSIIVGIVCCCRKKQASEGQVISTSQESSNQAITPTAPYRNSSQTFETAETGLTISDRSGASTAGAEISSLNNTNNNNNTSLNSINTNVNQRTTARPETQRNTDQPPSYESLPPSYSSLFEINS